ncbi:MAG: hypothetical protein R2838_20745 [Caldilineaceae bacterium]
MARIRPDGVAWLDGDLHYPGIGVELLDGARRRWPRRSPTQTVNFGSGI